MAQDLLSVFLLQTEINGIFSLHRRQFLHHECDELGPVFLLLVHPSEQVLNNIQHYHPPRFLLDERKGGVVFARGFRSLGAVPLEAEGLPPVVVFHCVLKYRRNDNRNGIR